MKDIDTGVGMMIQADKFLTSNFDLKIKISQILYQEKQDTQNGMKFAKEALEIKPNDIEALIMLGKMYIKEKDGENAIPLLT